MTQKPPAKSMTPAQATRFLNKISADDLFALAIREHAFERMAERGLLVDDIMHVLRQGFVHEAGEKTTRKGVFKYKVQGTTPNSDRRQIGVIVAMDETQPLIARIITVMWVDEK